MSQEDEEINSIKVLSTYVSNFGENIVKGLRELVLTSKTLRFVNSRLRNWLRKKELDKNTPISTWIFDGLKNLLTAQTDSDSLLKDSDFDALHNFFPHVPSLTIEGDNSETEIDLRFFSSLFDLEIRNCNIIFVSGADNVKFLRCLECSIDIRNFPSLVDARFSKCPKISVSVTKDLRVPVSIVEKLQCRNTSIKKISDVLQTNEFVVWERLETLDCKNNKLKSVPGNFDSLKFTASLTNLNLSHNNFSEIHKGTFMCCVHLKKLDLSHNQISSIDGLVELQSQNLIIHANSSSRMKTEKQISGNETPLLYSLQFLNLSHNNITKLHGIERLETLEQLFFSFNQINEWESVARLSNLKNIQKLSLHGNTFLQKHESYRSIVCGFFPFSNNFELDDVISSQSELNSHSKDLMNDPVLLKMEYKPKFKANTSKIDSERTSHGDWQSTPVVANFVALKKEEKKKREKLEQAEGEISREAEKNTSAKKKKYRKKKRGIAFVEPSDMKNENFQEIDDLSVETIEKEQENDGFSLFEGALSKNYTSQSPNPKKKHSSGNGNSSGGGSSTNDEKDVNNSLEEEIEDPEKVKMKLEDLKKDAGAQWLLLLNEEAAEEKRLDVKRQIHEQRKQQKQEEEQQYQNKLEEIARRRHQQMLIKRKQQFDAFENQEFASNSNTSGGDSNSDGEKSNKKRLGVRMGHGNVLLKESAPHPSIFSEIPPNS